MRSAPCSEMGIVMTRFCKWSIKKLSIFEEYRKESLPQKVKLGRWTAVAGSIYAGICIITNILGISPMYVAEKYTYITYIPLLSYLLLVLLLIFILNKRRNSCWRLLEFICYTSLGVLPYWGIMFMCISRIEDWNTNPLVWNFGMAAACGAMAVLPIYSILNIVLATITVVVCMNILSFDFGCGSMENMLLYCLICICISVLRFYDGYSDFKKKKKLAIANEIAIAHKEEADRANKSKDDFLAHMSHEIRTPINAILGMDELILRNSSEEQIVGYAKELKNAGNMLLALVNDILDFSKIRSGKFEIINNTYKLSSTLSDLYNSIQVMAAEKKLALEFVVHDGVPEELFGDDIRVKQVVLNILTNAVKYTKKGSVVLTVDSENSEEESVIIFRVKDTGIGIKKEDLPDLFERFKRLDTDKNHYVEGSGLGLNIVTLLLSQMEGSIDVESEYGKGSEFTIRIPQKRIGEKMIAASFNPAQAAVRDKNAEYKCSVYAPDANILIVDDNAVNRVLAKALLKDTGIKIDLADSGKAFLEMICEKHYDIIFLDHKMPEMDGIEALHEMKKKPGKCSDSCVIALTANALRGAREYYIHEGFDDFLEKPIPLDRYETLIREYLPHKLLQ